MKTKTFGIEKFSILLRQIFLPKPETGRQTPEAGTSDGLFYAKKPAKTARKQG
ncbi:hypothetical protein [uncultured Gemmiger sp.]|uniref:hypothetical protein n=1 Tax=uncultured Gemmiger sp. TaxID=1623490 RepID=UPI0025F2441D|nr:hypothetical protein [uncultured Gemmiger sp.]